MHEHMQIGFPGWELDVLEPGPTRRDVIMRGVDRVHELQAGGFRSMVDPCPNDMGRDVEIMAEVSARTGFNVICATGFYHDGIAAPYWRMKVTQSADGPRRLAEFLTRELTVGVGDTGIKPGVIKVATGHGAVTPYETGLLQAAAMAAVATGTPITTHTDGVLGPEQLRILGETGCPPHRVIVGHSCGNPDPAYHRAIVDAGAYIGFDRFGLTMIRLDEGRIDSLLTLVRAGEIGRVIISHDSPWCLRGSIWSGEALRTFTDLSPMHFSRNIVPRLKQFGMDDSHFDALLIDNPRNYFSGLS
jgi:phosphotriesterase-related protein